MITAVNVPEPLAHNERNHKREVCNYEFPHEKDTATPNKSPNGTSQGPGETKIQIQNRYKEGNYEDQRGN